jgi:hypothetical protein
MIAEPLAIPQECIWQRPPKALLQLLTSDF